MINIKKILFVTSFLIFLLPIVEAIGLISPDIGTLVYRPNYDEEFEYFVRNYNYDFVPYVSGKLSEYMILSPLLDHSPGIKQFNLRIKFPDKIELEPGIHIHNIGVKEVGGPGGMVGALTAVQTRLKIEVYSKDKVIKADFDAPDANEKEIMTFRIKAQSLTYQNIAAVRGRIAIYDLENNSLASFDTNEESLASGQSKTLEADWNNSILVPGNYRAEALVIYDGESMLLEDPFKIGTLKIRILNYTNEFISGQINEFKVEVENVWNNHVSDIYAELLIDNEKVIKTATIDLGPWEKGIINSYWNVTLAPWEYNGKIRLYYAGTYSEKNIKVIVIKEEPRLSVENIYAIVSLGLLLLVLVLAYIIIRLNSQQRKKKKKPTKAKKKKHRK